MRFEFRKFSGDNDLFVVFKIEPIIPNRVNYMHDVKE